MVPAYTNNKSNIIKNISFSLQHERKKRTNSEENRSVHHSDQRMTRLLGTRVWSRQTIWRTPKGLAGGGRFADISMHLPWHIAASETYFGMLKTERHNIGHQNHVVEAQTITHHFTQRKQKWYFVTVLRRWVLVEGEAPHPYLGLGDTVSGQLDSGKIALPQDNAIHHIAADILDLLAHFSRYFLLVDFISNVKFLAASRWAPLVTFSP